MIAEAGPKIIRSKTPPGAPVEVVCATRWCHEILTLHTSGIIVPCPDCERTYVLRREEA